jgi:glucokinase
MAVAGVDIGGTFVKAVVLAQDDSVVAHTTEPTRAPFGETKVSELIARTIEGLCKEPGLAIDDVVGVGLSIPGIVEDGAAYYAPSLGWRNEVDVARMEDGILPAPCTVANDAVCAGIAESRIGAARGYARALVLTIGTGVGASYIVDGNAFEGFGRFGGELAHIPLGGTDVPCSCGIKGCMQQCCSAVALGYLAKDRMDSHPNSLLANRLGPRTVYPGAEDVFKAADEGCGVALETLGIYYDYLAQGIGGLVNIFRPDCVVLGGGLVAAQPRVAYVVDELLGSYVYASEFLGRPPVLAAETGTFASAIGAALMAQGA